MGKRGGQPCALLGGDKFGHRLCPGESPAAAWPPPAPPSHPCLSFPTRRAGGGGGCPVPSVSPGFPTRRGKFRCGLVGTKLSRSRELRFGAGNDNIGATRPRCRLNPKTDKTGAPPGTAAPRCQTSGIWVIRRGRKTDTRRAAKWPGRPIFGEKKGQNRERCPHHRLTIPRGKAAWRG